MFVISQSDSYTWPVKVKIPIDGGRFSEQPFTAKFKRLHTSRIEQAMEAKDQPVADFCKEVMIGWSGVKESSDGPEMPFSTEALEKLLEVPTVALAIFMAWCESVSGGKQKN